MDDLTFEHLLTLPENDVIDYKEQGYKFYSALDEGKFIKDILSFANSIREVTSYIITGVKLENGKKILLGNGGMMDDASFQQKFENKIFPKPKFTVSEHYYQNKVFGIIEIPVHPYQHPLRATGDFKPCKAGDIYMRRSSNNSLAGNFEAIDIQKWLDKLGAASTINIQVEPPPLNIFDPDPTYLSRTVSRIDGDPLGMYFSGGERLIDVIKTHQHVALLGWGLSGKSTELKQLAYELAKAGETFPYFIPLGNHVDENIAERIQDIERVPEEKLVVLLDGLDEVLPDRFEIARRKISQFVNDYPFAKVVVSCRTNFYTTSTDELGTDTLVDFESYKLNQLDYEQIERYVDEVDPQNKKGFYREVEKKQIGELLATPYYLLKLSQQYKVSQKISDNKAALFHSEIRQLISKEVASKQSSGQQRFERHLHDLFQRLAFIMEAKGTNEISTNELDEIFPNLSDFEKVVNAGSIFFKANPARETWKFNHNNTQEYLAAEILMAQPFKKIKRIIGIGPDFERVKPSWVNTLSFLTSILGKDDDLKKKITSWLVKYNRELVVMLEPEKTTPDLRLKTFKSILEDYEKDGRRINRTIYRPENLATFSESPDVFDYLLRRFEKTSAPIVINNALEVINFYTLKDHPKYQEKFKLWYEKFLFGDDPALYYLALIGYAANFTLTTTEFKAVYEKFKDNDDTWIRFQLFQAIWSTGNQEVLISYVLAQAKLLIREDRRFSQERHNKNRLSNEYSEIAHCLEGIRTAKALISLFTDLKDEFVSFAHSTYFGNALEKVLVNAAKYPRNIKLCKQLDQIFLANHGYILYDVRLKKAFLGYFEATGRINELLHQLYRVGTLDFAVGHSIALLATPSFIDFLFLEALAGRISPATVNTLERLLENTANPNEGYFRQIFSRPPPAARPLRDWKKEKTENEKRNLAALFDQNIYLQEVEKIFKTLEKTTITYNDTYSHIGPIDYWGNDFLTVAREALDLSPHTGHAVLNELQVRIERNFDSGFIARIYTFLLRNQDAEPNEEQRKTLIEWCDQMAETADFKTAIKQQNPSNWDLDQDSVIFSFFVRKLGLDHYHEELYKDMMSFIKYDDTLIEIIPFVNTVIGLDKTRGQVLINLRNGIDNSRSLGDHLNFIQQYQLREVRPLLVPYLMGHEDSNHYQLLKIFLELGGQVKELKEVLKQSSGYFRETLIEEFVREGGEFIEKYLRKQFKKSEIPEEKLVLSRFLIRLQDEDALAYYILRIKATGNMPDDSSPHNPLYFLKKVKFTTQILDLYELAQEPKYYSDSFKDLRSISSNSLRNIALFKDNFPKFNKRVKIWMAARRTLKKFRRTSIHVNLLPDVYFFLENFSREFFNRVEMLSLKEAIALFRAMV